MHTRWSPLAAVVMAAALTGSVTSAVAAPLGLPPVPIPADNPLSQA